MTQSSGRQKIFFDSSAIVGEINYLKEKTPSNLSKVISTKGCQLAYQHYRWSSQDNLKIDEFWSNQLNKISSKDDFEEKIKKIEKFLTTQEQSSWLDEVLRYLPKQHVFNTTVYLIIGYDNVVFNEDVTLNLNNYQFYLDNRESIYYLIHELAHAGYLHYHRMPDLKNIKTWGELSSVVKFLTHLEGMGVISPLRLREKQQGFLDEDYVTLLNPAKVDKRVKEYFSLLSELEKDPEHLTFPNDYEIFEKMSSRPKRLWYITGYYMAKMIESKYSLEILSDLVKKGNKDFFEAYNKIN